MTDKKELQQEQLEKVSGGVGNAGNEHCEWAYHLKMGQQIKPDEMDLFLGREIAVKLDVLSKYFMCYGTLTKVSTISQNCSDKKLATVKMHPGSSYDFKKPYEVNGDEVSFVSDYYYVYLIEEYL